MKRSNEDTNESDRKRLRTPDADGKLDGIPLEAQTEPVQYHCDCCSKDISNVVKVRCAVCPEFEMCIECFSVGTELKGHKQHHSYRVIDNMHFPFFELSWSADEEMLLLEGLEIYGIGNWKDISDHVSTKDQHQCKKHYTEYYVQSPEWPNISFNNSLATRERVMLLNSGKYNQQNIKREFTTKNKTTKRGGGTPQKAQQSKSPIVIELNGYMPLRGEFETDWDNNAENKIKDIVFDEDDSPEQENVKLTLLECYYARLKIRKQKEKFVVDKKLHDSKYQEQLARTRSKEASELHGSYKRFIQIFTPEEYEAFLEELAKQHQLELKVQRLQNYRKNGITTTAEARQYEEELSKRKVEKKKPKSWKTKINKAINQPMNLEGQPGFSLLSKSEQELCQNFHIIPQDFFRAKEAFMSEYVKSCDLAKNTAIQLTDLEVDKAGKIYDFFQEVGWINNRAHLVLDLQRRPAVQLSDKESEKQDEEEPEEEPKPQLLTSFLKTNCSSAAPLRFGSQPGTTNLFKWQRA
eukprot:TRINITY_DN3700_c0_g1_i1.p1 TRINITY_DN3700_c0_g1~~TRINITY_DN3700_c0_g1_i1.p1  ORF type:complete len:522 (-),score=105.95 TRINITY_DN3700_c0_g1_i1:63-1628(-)